MIGHRRSCPYFYIDDIIVRDATPKDIQTFKVKNSALWFFGSQDLSIRFKTSIYSFYMQNSRGQFAGYASFEAKPNVYSIHPGFWINWIRQLYNMTEATYGNTVFLTFLQLYDPYNNSILKGVFQEIFLREPKVKFICTVMPPIDSIYEDVLGVHCRQIRAVDESVSRLCQSLFICERYNIIPKMRFRRALAEDNDDLVEIIDEKVPEARVQLGDFYIAEQVTRNDPSENIVVAEISHVTVGMIWINTNVHQKILTDNYETNPYGNFIRPRCGSYDIETRIVKDIVRKPSEVFFDPQSHDEIEEKMERKPPENKRMSMNNFYLVSMDSVQTAVSVGEGECKNIFRKWEKISKTISNPESYTEEIIKSVKTPKNLEMTNAFVIQLFGLSKTVDPRRFFDVIAAAFASYPDKDYCLISLSSDEASSDAVSGYLLRYFSRVVPRSSCKISDCLYVTHRNSFTLEIEVDYVSTEEDCNAVKNLLNTDVMSGKGIYYTADILQIMNAYVFHGWAQDQVLIMRSGGCCIGFAVLRQNTMISELCANFKVYDDDDVFPAFKVGELRFLLLHPAFLWEWVHVTRQIFRLTNFFSMYFRLAAEYKKPILNSMLLYMFPIFPRKRIKATEISPYALYYLNVKMCHLVRDQIEKRIVIIGFNETCRGFLRSLFYSSYSTNIQCLNMTVIAKSAGEIAADHDIRKIGTTNTLFYEAKNQFTTDYMRRLEFRTWVRFLEAHFEHIDGEKRRIHLFNGTSIRYDKLYLMCSNRYTTPKLFITPPSNYMEINNRLNAITFLLKIKLLVKEMLSEKLPIIVYGQVMMAHACINALLEQGWAPQLIYLVSPSSEEQPLFPEVFDDEYVSDVICGLEKKAGVKVMKGLKFIDWKLYETENTIETVTFESNFQKITVKCLAFISFYRQSLSTRVIRAFLRSGIAMKDERVLIDEYSKTNIPHVYGCGRVAIYKEDLFAGEIEQCFYNQIDIGNKLATNFLKERLTGVEPPIIDSKFAKPLFRQTSLIDGYIYGALRSPGRYTSHCIKRSFKIYDVELITIDGDEYCRVTLDKSGFIVEIICLTRKYKALDVIYRIYHLHESMMNNLKLRWERGEIKNLLDYFHKDAFAVVIHDQFITLRETMRKNNVACLSDLLKDLKKGQFNREQIENRLNMQGMNNTIRDDVYKFIKKHWKSLRPHYALPEDFAELEP